MPEISGPLLPPFLERPLKRLLKRVEGDHHEAFPTETLPQGTQAHGVLHEHEERDVNFPALFRSVAALFLSLAAVMAAMWGMFFGLVEMENRAEKMPSLMFGARRVPPEPRLLPNPVDNPARPFAPLEGPADYFVRQRAADRKELEKLQLLDPETGQPVLPAAVLQHLPSAGGPSDTGLAGVGEPIPSDASGGTRAENSLR